MNHTKEEIAAIASECYKQITTLTPKMVFWSWGVSNVQSTEYKGMASLVLRVNGYLHRGLVIVSLNEGSDTYEVYCLDDKLSVVKEQQEVYFDMLGSVIDAMVEQRPENVY